MLLPYWYFSTGNSKIPEELEKVMDLVLDQRSIHFKAM